MKTLTPFHQTCAYILSLGIKPEKLVEIAEAELERSISVRTIYEWRSFKVFADKVKEFENTNLAAKLKTHESVRHEIDNAVLAAIKKLAHLAENAKSEQVQEKACLDIVHLGGYKPVERLDVNQTKTDHLVLIDPEGSDDGEDYGSGDIANDDFVDVDDILDDPALSKRMEDIMRDKSDDEE